MAKTFLSVVIAVSVASSRPISLRYQFDSRRLLVAHFVSFSCGSATQLSIATVARAFSSAPFANFTTHNSDLTIRVGNLLCMVSITCTVLLPFFFKEFYGLFFFESIFDLKLLLTANHAKGAT